MERAPTLAQGCSRSDASIPSLAAGTRTQARRCSQYGPDIPAGLFGARHAEPQYARSRQSSGPDRTQGIQRPRHPIARPSNSSDTGSDLAGPGLIDDDLLGLDRGTNQDSEAGHLDAADAGADVGDLGLDDTTDREGTGEHLTAGSEPDVRVGGDIAPDRIVGPEEAGLGGGLDQAEEAQLGITDEELEDMLRNRRTPRQ